MLTRKQQLLLLFINENLQNDGVAPSFEEMKESLGLRSKSGVHRLIKGLEERGFIRRLPHRARALKSSSCPMTVESAREKATFPTVSPKMLSVANFRATPKKIMPELPVTPLWIYHF